MSSNDLEDSISALIELHRLQKTLQEKLGKLHAEVAFDHSKSASEGLTLEELNNEASGLERHLSDLQNKSVEREKIINMTLFGQETFKSSYADQGNFHEHESKFYSTIQNSIACKLEELKSMNKLIFDKQNKLQVLEMQFHDVKQRLHSVVKENRYFNILLQQAESETDLANCRTQAENENKQTKDLREDVENLMKELKLRKELFLGLIHAAKLDWFEDEEMRDFVLNLSQPIDFDIPSK